MENKVGKFCSSTVTVPPRVGILLVICCHGKHVRIPETTELEDTGAIHEKGKLRFTFNLTCQKRKGKSM